MRRLVPSLCALLLVTGCAQAPDPTPAPEPTPAPTQEAQPTPEPGLRVHTDYSKLTDRPQVQSVGGRWHEGYMDHLLPADYGAELLPYAGLRLMDDWPSTEGGGCLYGLMTPDGRAVTDPVYSGVARVDANGWWGRDAEKVLPMLVLTVGEEMPEEGYTGRRKLYAFSAADGSWCTEHRYLNYAASAQGVFASTGTGCELIDLSGQTVSAWTWEELGYSAERPAPFSFNEIDASIYWIDGLVALEENEEQVRVLDTQTGALATLSAGEWEARWQAQMPEEYPEDRFDPFSGERYQVTGDQLNGPMVLLNSAGTELARIERPGWYSSLKLVGGLVERVDWDTASYLDREGNVVFRCILITDGD